MILFARVSKHRDRLPRRGNDRDPVEECHDMVGISSLIGHGRRRRHSQFLRQPGASHAGRSHRAGRQRHGPCRSAPRSVSHLGERLCKLVARFYNLDV